MGRQLHVPGRTLGTAAQKKALYRRLAERLGQQLGYLDVNITEGTNDKNEKTAYVRQVFDAVAAVFGPLAPPDYIALHEVRADAWGYGGQTQEWR